jgi:hypothetical protein
MRAEDLNTFLRLAPFGAFRVHMSDGTIFEVRHPEMFVLRESSAWVYFPEPQTEPADYHHDELISLLHIVRVEPVRGWRQ